MIHKVPGCKKSYYSRLHLYKKEKSTKRSRRFTAFCGAAKSMSQKAQMKMAPLKLLCLHSFRTSGDIMSAQMAKYSNFAAAMTGLVTLHFLDGPRVCDAAAVAKVPAKIQEKLPPPYFEWWNAREDEAAGTGTVIYDDLDRTLALLREAEQANGPFDGVLGFSQGGCVAHLAVLLQQRSSEPLFTSSPHFGIFLSCRLSRHQGHEDLVRSCTANPLDLASLIIYGGSDTEVPPALTEELAATLDPARQATIFFPDGGHRIPKFNEDQTSALRAFLETQQHSIQDHRKEKE